MPEKRVSEKEAIKIIKESWKDGFPSGVKVTVRFTDGPIIFEKKGGEKPK